jgi:hypothetical protein
VAELVAEIGGASLVVGDGASQETAYLLTVPEVPAAFSALTCLVPLQILSCL